MSKKRVFISCRIYEMREFREQAILAIKKAGFEPIFIDTSDDSNKLSLRPGGSLMMKLLEAVNTADVFLGLYGEELDTNWVPDGEDKHSMVLEYEAADKAGIPSFFYTPPSNANFDRDMFDFRKQVMQQKIVGFLSTPEELHDNLLLKLKDLRSRIFISYSSKDQQFVNELFVKLRKSGHHSWLNTESIPKGNAWHAEMTLGLKNTELMILVVSPDSVASKWVREEWETYLSLNKKILPVLLRDCEVPTELQKIEMVFQKKDDWYHELLKAIEQNL